MSYKAVNFNNFRFGRLDRKIIMRGGLNYRTQGFVESDNVFCTDNLTAVPRPGTRLVVDFEDKPTRIIPFSRGQNQQYLLVLQPNKQYIYYVDMEGNLVPTLANDVSLLLVPNLTSNVDQGYTVTGNNGALDYYKIFSTAGYTGQDITDVTIEFPSVINIYGLEFTQGNAVGFTVTLTKSDDSTLTVDAVPEYTGSTKYVMPTGYDYSDVISVQIRSFIKVPVYGGSSYPSMGRGASSGRPGVVGYRKEYGGYIQGINIWGAAIGSIAEWTYPINWPIAENLDYDQNNAYLFLAHQSIVPYVVSISGTFTFTALNPTFPQDYDFTSMGYPAHVACGQSRLWFANMEKEPTSIIASKIGYELTDFQDFKPDVQSDALMPDSAMKFTPIEMKNRIEWILGGDSVGIGSWDGTYKMFYGQNGVISATGAAIKQQNEDSACSVKPAWKDGKLIFTGISRNNLRMMDYNMYVNRQQSDDISKFHTELMGRIIKKTIIKKDASNDIYVLFEDGTAAMAHFYTKEDRGFFPFSVANAEIKDINVVKSDNGDRLYLTCYYLTDNTWKLLLVDEMEFPAFPNRIEPESEYQEEISRWVKQKAPLDYKVYEEHPLTFLPEEPLYVSQIQRFDPAGIDGIIEQYGPYVVFLNDPTNGVTWDDLIGKTLFFEDSVSLYDFYVTIYKVDDFVFGIPSNPDNKHWNNVILTQGNYNYAFLATSGYIGITQITLKYPTSTVHIFSDREYLGEFNCVDQEGNYLTQLTLPKAVANLMYGQYYQIYCSLGNVSAWEGKAKRRVSAINFNTFGSWGLAVQTETTAQLVQLYDPRSVYGLIPNAMDTWTNVKLNDGFSTEKTITIWQTIPYPFEIMGISVLLEENDTEMGI